MNSPNKLSQISIYAGCESAILCIFLLFGANGLQIRKNDYASRLAEILAPITRRFAKMMMREDLQKWKKHAFCRLGLVQNLS
jgi:hypothetical protein